MSSILHIGIKFLELPYVRFRMIFVSHVTYVTKGHIAAHTILMSSYKLCMAIMAIKAVPIQIYRYWN